MLDNTSIKMDELREKFKAPLPTFIKTMIELKYFRGLLYMSWVKAFIYVEGLLANDGAGWDIFCVTMSMQRRFLFARTSFHFDDAATRDMKEEDDKLAAIKLY